MNENLRLGSPTIDQQHQALFYSFERLSALAGEASPDEMLSEILSKLSHQIHHHFMTEEMLMAGLPLPPAMLRAHRAAHEQILEELAQIHFDAMAGKPLSLQEIIAAVATWVSRHLVEYDLELKPYINGQAG